VRKRLLAMLAAIFLVADSTAGISQDIPFLTISPEPANYAWWLRTEYHPFGADLRGIPAARVHRGWCKVNELRRDLFPAEEAASFGDTRSPFAVDGFFDGSKIRHTAVVGAYQACKGARGLFFLIVAWPEGKPPVIRHLVELPGDGQLAVVWASKDGTITLQHCLECDHASQYKWDRSGKRFGLLPERDDE
jgi:hypothetical protein